MWQLVGRQRKHFPLDVVGQKLKMCIFFFKTVLLDPKAFFRYHIELRVPNGFCTWLKIVLVLIFVFVKTFKPNRAICESNSYSRIFFISQFFTCTLSESLVYRPVFFHVHRCWAQWYLLSETILSTLCQHGFSAGKTETFRYFPLENGVLKTCQHFYCCLNSIF